MADEPKKAEQKTLEMRVAELEDRLAKIHITEDELKAYQKVASLVGGQAAAAGPTPQPFTCIGPCVPNPCVISQCIIQQCIIRQCIIRQCIIQQCTFECGGGSPGGGQIGGGGLGGIGGGGFGGLGG